MSHERADSVENIIHGSAELIAQYVLRTRELAEDEARAWEAHVDNCADCRRRIAEVAGECAPPVSAVVDAVWQSIGRRVSMAPAVRGRRVWAWHLRMWAPPAGLPWLGSVIVVLAIVSVADYFGPWVRSGYPPLLMLVAPVAPVLGVGMAWARRVDPAYELVVATPRAGLSLVLRRTLVVLAVVTPALLALGWIVHVPPARWLFPSFAFTVVALALGGMVGVSRAVAGLAVLWAGLVVGPSLYTSELSAALSPNSLVGWILACVTGLAVLAVEASRGAFSRMAGHY